MKRRTITLAATALAAGLILAGCTTPASSTMPSDMPGMDHGSSDETAQFNDSDIEFVTQMIPHHQQAVEMAEILLAKVGVDSRVTDLATEIKAAQAPEIATMTEWLAQWGQPSPEPMDGMLMNGMMSPSDMDALTNASGPDSSALFLQQMIEHHEGAIVMAQMELNVGDNADALALAQTIFDAQTSEIATMQQLLELL